MSSPFYIPSTLTFEPVNPTNWEEFIDSLKKMIQNSPSSAHPVAFALVHDPKFVLAVVGEFYTCFKSIQTPFVQKLLNLMLNSGISPSAKVDTACLALSKWLCSWFCEFVPGTPPYTFVLQIVCYLFGIFYKLTPQFSILTLEQQSVLLSIQSIFVQLYNSTRILPPWQANLFSQMKPEAVRELLKIKVNVSSITENHQPTTIDPTKVHSAFQPPLWSEWGSFPWPYGISFIEPLDPKKSYPSPTPVSTRNLDIHRDSIYHRPMTLYSKLKKTQTFVNSRQSTVKNYLYDNQIAVREDQEDQKTNIATPWICSVPLLGNHLSVNAFHPQNDEENFSETNSVKSGSSQQSEMSALSARSRHSIWSSIAGGPDSFRKPINVPLLPSSVPQALLEQHNWSGSADPHILTYFSQLLPKSDDLKSDTFSSSGHFSVQQLRSSILSCKRSADSKFASSETTGANEMSPARNTSPSLSGVPTSLGSSNTTVHKKTGSSNYQTPSNISDDRRDPFQAGTLLRQISMVHDHIYPNAQESLKHHNSPSGSNNTTSNKSIGVGPIQIPISKIPLVSNSPRPHTFSIQTSRHFLNPSFQSRPNESLEPLEILPNTPCSMAQLEKLVSIAFRCTNSCLFRLPLGHLHFLQLLIDIFSGFYPRVDVSNSDSQKPLASKPLQAPSWMTSSGLNLDDFDSEDEDDAFLLSNSRVVPHSLHYFSDPVLFEIVNLLLYFMDSHFETNCNSVQNRIYQLVFNPKDPWVPKLDPKIFPNNTLPPPPKVNVANISKTSFQALCLIHRFSVEYGCSNTLVLSTSLLGINRDLMEEYSSSQVTQPNSESSVSTHASSSSSVQS